MIHDVLQDQEEAQLKKQLEEERAEQVNHLTCWPCIVFLTAYKQEKKLAQKKSSSKQKQ